MISKVDYFSYTFYVDDALVSDQMNELDIMKMLRNHKPDYFEIVGQEPTIAPRRVGFVTGIAIGKHTFIWGNKKGLILIEHTGQGCQLLNDNGNLADVIATYADRATRIDIASDILTETMPADFYKQSSPQKRITASGHQSSDSGQTIYVGSKKSDRTVKVYRYFPPHPRAEFLRIEYTYRKQQAKVVARLLANGATPAEISVSSGKRYGWQHPSYKPLISPDVEISAWRPERRQGKTVAWVYSQVIPAIRRLVAEGALDLQEFIKRVS